jgi:predicted RecA/RadA family phage recombinase
MIYLKSILGDLSSVTERGLAMLSKKTMQNLEVGQRIRFSDGVMGTVTSVNKFAVGVNWEDDQSGYISTDDGQNLSLAEDDAEANQ